MQQEIKFIINDKGININISPAFSLLDFIRNEEHLTGTKEGCREGDCGACTVLIGELIDDKVLYKNVNSCLFPIGDAAGKHIVTIEGLNSDKLSPVQESFIKETATQCGFCTPGFIVSLTSYLLNTNTTDMESAVDTIAGNICRCTGHTTIKRGVSAALDSFNWDLKEDKIEYLIKNNFLPEYFLTIPSRLKEISTNSGNTNPGKKILLSGGTDLMVQKWEELLDSDVTVMPLTKDQNIREEENKIFIKGNTTISEIVNSSLINKYYPELKEKLKLFGSLPIRNRATAAGNIINASPIGDLTNILLALDAELLFAGPESRRTVKLENLYKGYKTLDKSAEELLEEISIPIPSEKERFNFEKVSRRTHLDIASVNSSIKIATDNNFISSVRISAGGTAAVPLLLKETCRYLTGKELSPEIINLAADIALTEISPISDARGSADYKKLLLHQLIIAHFVTLFPELIAAEELL